MSAQQGRLRPHRSALVVGALLLATAAVIVFDASRLEITSTYGLGPKAAPFVIAAGLAVLGLCHLVMAFRAAWPAPEPADPMAIVSILAGLALLIGLIGLGGGFIPATAVLFAATARAFGRRAILVDLAIGLALGVIVFLVFDRLLTLSLPAGPLERLLGA